MTCKGCVCGIVMFVDVEADRMEAGMEGVLEVEQADRSTVKDSQGMLWMC